MRVWQFQNKLIEKKVQGVPKTQATANPLQKEVEKKDRN